MVLLRIGGLVVFGWCLVNVWFAASDSLDSTRTIRRTAGDALLEISHQLTVFLFLTYVAGIGTCSFFFWITGNGSEVPTSVAMAGVVPAALTMDYLQKLKAQAVRRAKAEEAEKELRICQYFLEACRLGRWTSDGAERALTEALARAESMYVPLDQLLAVREQAPVIKQVIERLKTDERFRLPSTST